MNFGQCRNGVLGFESALKENAVRFCMGVCLTKSPVVSQCSRFLSFLSGCLRGKAPVNDGWEKRCSFKYVFFCVSTVDAA